MIDLIKLRKKNISENEKNFVIQKSNLKPNFANGKQYHDNASIKNFEGGFYVKIDHENTLKIEGSLHKFWNWTNQKKLVNDNRFTISNAYQIFKNLVNFIGFEPTGVLVTHFEIGANIPVNIDAKVLLSKVLYISVFDDLSIKKQMLINPKYRDARHITTYFNKGIKIYYRMYDKYFEMRMKEKTTPENGNLIRIETVNLNVTKMLLTDFMKLKTLQEQKNIFFKKWQNVFFDFDVIAPSGTYKSRIDLAKEIILHGTTFVIDKYKIMHSEGKTTKKTLRGILEFCRDWHTLKKDYLVDSNNSAKAWQTAYISEIQQLN